MQRTTRVRQGEDPPPRRGRPRKPLDAAPSPDQLRRLKFIERAALWTGQIGRRAVAASFDVSIGHASLDFQRYRDMAPCNLLYDVNGRCYRPTTAFQPIFADEDARGILDLIAATVSLDARDQARLLGFELSADAVAAIPAAIDPTMLMAVLRAITAGAMIDIRYQSMATPEPKPRAFAPHSLIFTGQRWLARGWDGRHEAYRDLALTRIIDVGKTDEPPSLPRDDRWHDRVALELRLADTLSPGQRTVTIREYGMTPHADADPIVTITSRQAMVPYLLDHLRIRPSDPASPSLPIRLNDYEMLRVFDRTSFHD